MERRTNVDRRPVLYYHAVTRHVCRDGKRGRRGRWKWKTRPETRDNEIKARGKRDENRLRGDNRSKFVCLAAACE